MNTNLEFRRPSRLNQRLSLVRVAFAVMATAFLLIFSNVARSQTTLDQAKQVLIGQWRTSLGDAESWTLEFRKHDIVWRGGNEVVAEGARWKLQELAGVSNAFKVNLYGESPDDHAFIIAFEGIDRIQGPLLNGTSAMFGRVGGSAMRNPGFEQPEIGQERFQFVDLVPGWKTTDRQFEVWGTGFLGVKAYEGEQFVELNAHEDGTLYQQSSEIEKDAAIEFSFAHRGRNGDDSMKLTLTDLGADNAIGGGDDTELFSKQYTTGNNAWVVYDSSTEPKIVAKGNSVRFAYTAVRSIGSTDKSEGNFLDAANFGVGVIVKRNAKRTFPFQNSRSKVMRPELCGTSNGSLAPRLPTKFIVETYGVHGRGNAKQPKHFIGIEGDQLKILQSTLQSALKNENGVQTITREKLNGGLVALKIGNRYLPDFSATVGDANRYREVSPLFPPETGEPDFISLQSANTSGVFLRHAGYRVFNGGKYDHEKIVGSEAERVFSQDVTWHFHEIKSTSASAAKGSGYTIQAISGNNQTYGGGGMPNAMVLKIKNEESNQYVTDLKAAGITIEVTSNNTSGKYDGAFENYSDYCKNGDKACFGGYYYVPPSQGKAYQLKVTVNVKKENDVMASFTFEQSIK